MAVLVFLIFSSAVFASPCLEAYKKAAMENTLVRNDELIALQMLYSEADLTQIKSESYFFLNNAVNELSSKKEIKTNFQELQAHIYAGFSSGEFCDKNTMPKKSAGQIIRLAKAQVRANRGAEQEIKQIAPKVFAPAALADSLNPLRNHRKPASGDFQK